MTWVAVAVVGAGVAGAAISGSAAQGAANTQAQSAANAQQISQNEFNTITAQEQPFMQGGYGALGALEYDLGIGGTVPAAPGTSSNGYQTSTGAPFTIGPGSASGINGYDPSSGFRIGAGGSVGRLLAGGSTPSAGSATPSGGAFGSLLRPFNVSDWQQLSPSYNFQLGQGMQGVLNGEASGAGALSGAAQKDLMSYNQNLANTSFNNAFNMYQTQQGNIYSRLAGLTQLGQAAAANTGQQGTALAGQAAQSATNIGTAQAAGQIGSANAWSGAIQGMSYLPWLTANSGSGGFGASGLTGY